MRAIAWAPSGETLATASFDANVGIWEQDPGEEGNGGGEWECASLLEGHETECKSVAYSSSGTLLASCSRDKTVWVWEGASYFFICLQALTLVFSSSRFPDSYFECLGVLMDHTQDVKCVAWHPSEEVNIQFHPLTVSYLSLFTDGNNSRSVDPCFSIIR